MRKFLSIHGIMLLAGLLLAAQLAAAQDSFIGEYEGTYQADRATRLKASGKVIAEGPDQYRLVLQAETSPTGETGPTVEISGVRQGGAVVLSGRANSQHWSGSISGDTLSANGHYYDTGFALTKVSRKSPTEGEKPPDGAVVLLPYEPGKAPDLSAWAKMKWEAKPDGCMECVPRAGSAQTKQSFGDCKLHVEFKLPLEPDHFGQDRANSGVHMIGRYEVQVLDSFGLVPSSGDCGAIYQQERPRVNACLPPGQWQTYDIVFRAPRMNGKQTVELPRITVMHNGITIHKNFQILGPTSGKQPSPNPNAARGPLSLQDHGHPVQFRNIWLVELPDAQP